MTRILVVEDEPGIAFALRADLESEGYAVKVATTGDDGLRLAQCSEFDLILLDVMLPGKDGFEVCRTLRRSGSKAPVILLTAKAQEAEKVMGLELGADDYVTKPFSPRELVARVRAVFRRVDEPMERGDVIRAADVTLDKRRMTVMAGNRAVALTATEFELLATLARHPGRVFTRAELLDAIRGTDVESYDRAIDAHVKNVRRKLEADPQHPHYLLTVHGVGYKFSE